MRIVVNPDQLRQAAQQMRRAGGALREIGGRVISIVSGLEMEVRSRANVDSQAAAARRQAESLANQAESLACFLEDRADAFQRADEQALISPTVQSALHGLLRRLLRSMLRGSISGVLSSLGGLLAFVADTGVTDLAQRVELDEAFQDFVDNREPYTDKQVGYPRDIPRRLLAQLAGYYRDDIYEGEADLMDQLDLLGLKRLSDVSGEAFAVEASFFGKEGEDYAANNDGVGDAFRHAYWSARLTQEFGPEWAGQFTDAHESKPGNEAARDFMDRWNNDLGIRIAKQHPDATPAELAGWINQAINDGEGVYIPGADQYPIGSTQRENLAENGPLAYTDQ